MKIKLDFVLFYISPSAVFLCSGISLGGCQEQWWLCTWARYSLCPGAAGGSPGGLGGSTLGSWDALSWDRCTVENWTTRNCPAIPRICPPSAKCQLILTGCSLSPQASNTDYIAQHPAPQEREVLKLYEPVGGKQREPQTSCFPLRRAQRHAHTSVCTCHRTKLFRRCHAVMPWLAKAISLAEHGAMGSPICPAAV